MSHLDIFLDSLGEEHNSGGATWISPLLVVVSVALVVVSNSDISPNLSVFWDLYCAAPERRETCDHSSEAKAFHDYVSSSAPSLKILN